MSVPTPETRVTIADILLAEKSTAQGLRLTTENVFVALNIPAKANRVTTSSGIIAAKATPQLRTTNAEILVAVAGRSSNPKVRAWSFSLDGHEFYVLRLGTMLTLVYDVYSEEWMTWDALSQNYWPVSCGMNWVGGMGLQDPHGNAFGSNVLVGDDTYGLVWILNPNQPYDQSPEVLDPVQQKYFPRVIQGQLPAVGREVMPCNVCWLTTDMGNPAYVGAGVDLSISDDGGQTYADMGTVTVTQGNNFPEIAWYSLGQVGAPGRLFLITDDGAVARIDGMEMNDSDGKQ